MVKAAVMTSPLVSRELCHKILQALPGGIALGFSYGSGAFRQTNNADPKKNMLDFILAVNNPEIWHRENLRMNFRHYSLMRYMGTETIANLQSNYGASVYFNTLVKVEDRYIKYGVISTDKLLQDLLDWKSLYVAGRLHKPVMIVEKQDSLALQTALKTNLKSALHTALLLLPGRFNPEDLYMTIATLSYAGDFRMTLGEDKNKICNIVKPNLARFEELYKGTVDSMMYLTKNGDGFQQEITYPSCLYHLENLPRNVHKMLIGEEYKTRRYRDVEEILRELATDLSLNEVVRRAITKIVKQSSWSQSSKGILTAGFWKSLRYSGSKLLKMAKTRRS